MTTHRAFLLLCLALPLAPAYALTSDAKQPINIRAKSVEANQKSGVTSYRGQVVLTQGSLKLRADRLDVSLRNGRTHLVRAWGDPVQVQSRADTGELIEASAARLEYYVGERRLDLHERVTLKRDGDVMTGAEVRYDFDTQDFTAEGGADDTVSAVIQPDTSQQKQP